MCRSKLKDSFLEGTSSTYLEELEERYRQASPSGGGGGGVGGTC